MRRRNSIAANPVLIGAATTLVVIVAVFLAYNANSGLPFVPTYDLTFNMPSGANLVKGNEVLIGGTRVGVIDSIGVKKKPNGQAYATLHTKLETSVDALPIDSTVMIRPKSALGQKYLQVTRGTSPKGFPNGGTVPLSAARPQPVEFDEFLSTFDEPTRLASRVNLYEFGNAVAGRGGDLNQFLEDLPPFLRQVDVATKNLAAPRTRLDRLFRALGQTAAEVAPVGEQQASLFVNLDTTFGAIAQVATPYLKESIANGPPALEAGIRSFPIQRPFLANSAALFSELYPASVALNNAAPDLAAAVVVGTPTLTRSVAFNEALVDTFKAIQTFSADPLVSLGVNDLTGAIQDLQPTLANITPSQTVCNYWTLLLNNGSSLLSEGSKVGTAQRFSIIKAPYNINDPRQTINNEGTPSNAPANGPAVANFLHSNPYPNTAAPGQPFECEAGNEKYQVGKQVIGNPPGNQGTLHNNPGP